MENKFKFMLINDNKIFFFIFNIPISIIAGPTVSLINVLLIVFFYFFFFLKINIINFYLR